MARFHYHRFENLFDSIFEEKQVSPEVAVLRVKTAWPGLASANWEIKNHQGVECIQISHEDVLACCVAGCKCPVVTSGALELLTQDELFCVLQHELSHIELRKYAVERRPNESFLSWAERDLLQEALIDEPVVEKYYNGDRSTMKNAVMKMIDAERERVVRVASRKIGKKKIRMMVARTSLFFIFGVMKMLTSRIRFKD